MAPELNPWSRSIALGAGPAGVWFISRARTYMYDVAGDKALKRAFTMASGCAYCGGEATTLDHVVPLARGGRNEAWNLWPCCQTCNVGKGSTPLLIFLALRLAHAWHFARQREQPKATTSMAEKLRQALGQRV